MSAIECRAPLRILACEGAEEMAAAIADELSAPSVSKKQTWFACGEGKVEIRENVRGCDVYVVQCPIVPGTERSVYDRLMMLLHAVEAAKLADADFVTAVVPYYPGSRQDKRKGRSREPISAGLVARMLETAGACRVITLEIHNEAISGMFAPARCMLENVGLSKSLARFVRAQGIPVQVVASPDVGGLERARYFAECLGVGIAALSKERDYSTPNKVLNATLIGSVRDQDVILIDDMVDTAGSVVAAVDELKEHGAKAVTVACAHPLLSGPAWTRLGALADRAAAEGWTFSFIGSTSVRHPQWPSWYVPYEVEHLLAKVIRNVNGRGSVSRAQESDA
ncbi:MAG: ribose-phosphate pyrophosphokinase [Proteobacteria bacterium]|nr:ribose-phosphate pyrophosphokinase [Pseudomonadota bacterium]MCP4920122.1 ribose-phosphate pyrophosphokinase [Pseudomonadota bacterium]